MRGTLSIVLLQAPSSPPRWAGRFVVAAIALVGITTALLVNMMGQSRIWTMAAREHMIPGFWAKVSPKFGTPVAAQVTMGAASGHFPPCFTRSANGATVWEHAARPAPPGAWNCLTFG